MVLEILVLTLAYLYPERRYLQEYFRRLQLLRSSLSLTSGAAYLLLLALEPMLQNEGPTFDVVHYQWR